MADSFKIIGGDLPTEVYELLYDAQNQADYKLQYNSNVQAEMPDVLMHMPDFGEELPIRGTDRDRTVFLGAHIFGTNWDDVWNNLNKLKRMIDGAHSQALQYWTEKDVPPVFLRVQLDGMTHYTNIPVKYGFVDDGRAPYESASILNKVALGVTIMLRVGPYGLGAPFVLQNELASSPHMLFEGGTAGLAANLTAVGSLTSQQIDNAYGIIGPSQKLVIPNAGTVGVETGDIAAPIGTHLEGYAWLHVGVGSNTCTVQLFDGGGNEIDSISCVAGTGDMTLYDRFGNSWERFPVSGVITTAANANLRIVRLSADANAVTTIWIDQLYLRSTLGKNLIPNPLMDVDEDSDDVVDGWLYSGSATGQEIDTDFYFSTPASQTIGDLSGTTRLGTYIYYNSTNQLTISAWVGGDWGGAATTMYVRDHADNTLATKTINPAAPAGYEDVATGDDSTDWYRYEIVLSPTAPYPEYVKLSFEGTANMISIDDVTAFEGTLSTSPAFISSRSLLNRNDHSSTNTSYINSIDVSNVPGDVPALATWRIYTSGANIRLLYAFRWSDGYYTVEDYKYWYESNLPTYTHGTGAWSDQTGTTSDHYKRYTHAGAIYGSAELSLTGEEAVAFASKNRRVFARVRSSSLLSKITMSAYVGAADNGIAVHESEAVGVTATGTFEIVDLGVVYCAGMIPRQGAGYGRTRPQMTVDFQLSGVPSSGTLDIDAIIMVPCDEFLVHNYVADFGINGTWINGAEKHVQNGRTGVTEMPSGSLWYLDPGKANRVVFIMAYSTNEWAIATNVAANISVEVTPRSRHLLGTL